MSNNNLFRFVGWSAILSVVGSLAMIGVVMASGRGIAFAVVSAVASLLTAIVFYGLYVLHRPQSAAASLSMLLCGIIGLVLENIGTGPTSTITMIAIGFYGVAFLLLGYLGYGNTQMPRWLATLAYAVGVLSWMISGASALGQSAATGLIGLIQILVWVVWSVGLARLFLSRKLAVA